MGRIPVLLLIFNRVSQALGIRGQFATASAWGPLRCCFPTSVLPLEERDLEAASAQSRWETQMARGRASVLGKGTGGPHECPQRGGWFL